MALHPEWYQFQEDICSYFISIGANAETNVTVQGVRTTHDIDILVKTKYLGEDLTWIIEAKKWKSRLNKLQVLGLRTIADDIGADRAFIISEAGFQSGAYEAAENAIDLAEKKEYPINLETFVVEKVGELIANNFQQLINWLNLNLNLLDEKLLKAEAKMIENNDFHPSIRLDRETDIDKFTKDSMKKAWHTIHQIVNKA